jgi:hypothetical protein
VSQTFQFYDARAKESAAEAKKAELVMVRERAERSAAVWRSLADQAKKVERDRAKAELVRAERRAAEADEAARIAETADAQD